MFDFHCHSTFSDGVHSPLELAALAHANGVRVLSLTDHDTTAGIAALQIAAAPLNVRIVPGVEVSVSWRTHVIHVLALGIDPEHAPLQHVLAQQKTRRIERARLMAQNLASLNIPNLFEKVAQLANDNNIARPHFAQVLITEGFVKNSEEAFKRYLKRGRMGYAPIEWISLEEAIEVIVSANGLAVLAHPDKYRLTRTKLHELLTRFKQAGGQGLEVVSGRMTDTAINSCAALCTQYGLLASSGSDFHGPSKSGTGLGRQSPLPLNCKPVWDVL